MCSQDQGCKALNSKNEDVMSISSVIVLVFRLVSIEYLQPTQKIPSLTKYEISPLCAIDFENIEWSHLFRCLLKLP